MIWLNPWAWLGLFTLAVPILVHLLARQRARAQRFPSLRFLERSRLITARRSTPTDLLLLALRLAILGAAVVALAQPYIVDDERSARAARLVSRVVVVDTSASMRRLVPGGRTAIDSARGDADAVAADASDADATVLVVHTPLLRTGLAGAAAWLEGRPGTRELLAVSDFQRGSMDAQDVAAIPAQVGLEFRRIPVQEASAAAEPVPGDRWAAGAMQPRITAVADTTSGVWSRSGGAADADTSAGAMLMLTADDDRSAADAVRVAVLDRVGAPPASTPIALLFPGHARHSGIVDRAVPLSAPWMGDVVAALHADPLLTEAAAMPFATEETAVADASGVTALGRARFAASPASPWSTIARNTAGEPVVRVAAADLDGAERLLLRVDAEPGSLLSAAAASAAVRAAIVTTATPRAELEPLTIGDDQLDAWRRPASPAVEGAGAAVAGGESDGRWVWLLVLGLIALESLVRRRTARSGMPGEGTA